VAAGTPAGPAPSRWTLRTIRAACPWLHAYTPSGVWRYLRRQRCALRSARVQQYSPDPDYRAKEAHLLACLRQTARHPRAAALVFLDEMGYCRWPEAAPDWAPQAPVPPPVAAHGQATNQQWRIIGALNALTGRVDYLANYIVGRKQVIAFYQRLARAYPRARRIYVVQDNWSIHRHEDVARALATLPQIEPVWLPTYAPWLNPIEKLWRWLRQEVLKLHRLAADWRALQDRVRAFLDQFARGSRALLHYVGLRGEGKLAQALHTHDYRT
jgi:transposase